MHKHSRDHQNNHWRTFTLITANRRPMIHQHMLCWRNHLQKSSLNEMSVKKITLWLQSRKKKVQSNKMHMEQVFKTTTFQSICRITDRLQGKLSNIELSLISQKSWVKLTCSVRTKKRLQSWTSSVQRSIKSIESNMSRVIPQSRRIALSSPQKSRSQVQGILTARKFLI